MKLAVQIILYRSSPHLEPLLRSLHAQTFQDFEAIFLENSEDAEEAARSQTMVAASGLAHRFIVADRNQGFAGGHQTMFLTHQAPFVMLLNDDAKLEPGYLEAVMRRMESDPNIGSVTGLIYRWTEDDRRVIDTAGLEYKCLGQIADRFAGRATEEVAETIAKSGEVFGVSGAIGLYRRSAVEKAGGLFDPAWFMYKEDADLAIRLRRAGFTAWFEPTAAAFHRRGLKEEGRGFFARLKSERQRSPLLRKYSYVNQWRIYRRHFRWSLGIRDICRTIMIESGRSLLVFLASPSVFFRAWRMILQT